MSKWFLIRWSYLTARPTIETLICVLIFSLCAVNAAFSQVSQDVWQPLTGDWSTAGNWSLGRVPLTTDDAVVDNRGTATVSTAGGTSYTIHNLGIGATMAGSTVEVNGGVTLNVAAITIGAGGTLRLDPGATFFQSGGFINNGNFIVNSGSINPGPIGGTGKVTKDSDFDVTWSAPLNAGASVTVNGGTFKDNTAGTGNAGVNVTVNSGTFVDNTGSLGNVTVNNGTFTENTGTISNAIVTGATSVLQVNAGVTLNTAPVLSNGGKLDNFGTITATNDGVDSTVGGATVTNEKGGVITGTNFAGVFVDGAAGNVTNAGTISGNTAAVFLNHGGTVTNQVGGAIHGNANDGVFVNNGAATVTNSGTITGQNGVRFDGPGGNLTNNAGGTILGTLGAGVGTFPGSFMNLTNSGTITGVSGAFFFSGATITNNLTGTITGNGGTGIRAIGGPITLSNTGIINGNVILDNFANSVTLVTGGVINGSLNAGNPNAASLTLGGAGIQTLSQAVTGTIGGFFSLAKQGTATWVIDEDLSYTGGTTIAAGGTLRIGNGRTTGSISGSVIDDGTLSFNRSNALTFTGGIDGSGNLIQLGTGTLILTGNSTYSGGTTISAGTQLQLGNGGTSGSIAGNVTDNGTLAFDRRDTVTFGGVISGIGSLVQAGTGTLVLTGTNTYSGGTFVNNGTLVADATGALGSSSVTVNDPSLLRIDPGVTVTNFIQLNNGGSLDNLGTVRATAATGALFHAAVTTSGGATIINEGRATIAGIGLIGIQSLSGPATINNTGAISGTEGIELSGGGTITNNAGGTITGVDGAAIATGGGVVFQATSGTVNNAGSISGASGISLTAGGTVTNNATGKVKGTGGTAVVIGGSQAKLSNAGQITGDVQLNGASNTAQLLTGGKITGNLTLNPSGTNQVILDGIGIQLLSQSVTGTISNAGSLIKQGTGDWILDENLSPPVDTLIGSGILQVNSGDVLTSPTVTVGSGAQLIGLGTIAGSLINNGLVTPGDAPGTLTVTGNYTQSASGTLNIQFASTGHGLLAVGGTAFLGGTLRLSLLGGFVPPAAQRLTILTAGGGISGVFGTVQQPTTATLVTVFYDPKDVQVQVGQVPYQDFACNPNTRSVLTALQSVRNTATGDLGVVIGVLNSVPTSQLCDFIAPQISPLPVPSLPTQVLNLLDNQSTELDQRRWFFEQPYDPQHRWDVYVNGSAIFGRIRNIFDLPALDFDTGTTTPGGEYRFSPSLGLGAYAGYAHSESRFSNGTRVSADTPNTGTYGLWNPPFLGPFGVDFGLGVGYNDYSMKRPIKFGDPIDRVARSNPRSKVFKERLGTSYHKKFGKLNVEVLGSYEYASIENDRFYEHGAFSLDTRVGKYDVDSLRQRFGIHLVYDIPINSKVTITPDCRLTWIHEYLDGTRAVPVSLNSGAGPNFSISQPHGPSDEYISVLGFYAVCGELKGYLYWTSDFGSGIVTSNSIMGGVTLNF